MLSRLFFCGLARRPAPRLWPFSASGKRKKDGDYAAPISRASSGSSGRRSGSDSATVAAAITRSS